MEGGGRGGGGRGKGKKGKKKAANAHHSGKKVSVHVQAANADSKIAVASTLHNATIDCPSTTATQEQTLSKSKRKRSKKAAMGAENTTLKKQMLAEAPKSMPAPAHERQAKNAPSTCALAKSHVVSLTGTKKKKKRKRNAMLATADSGGVAMTMQAKSGPQSDGKKSLAHVTKQKMVVWDHSQDTQKSEISTTTAGAMASRRKVTEEEKENSVEVSAEPAGSMLVMPKDECQVIAKRLKPNADFQQTTCVVDASKPTKSLVKRTSMQQQVDTSAMAKPKSGVATTSHTNVKTTKKTAATPKSSPSMATFDDKPVASPQTPDASTTDSVVSSKPSHTASAAANMGTISKNPDFREPMSSEATSSSTGTTKTSPVLTDIAASPELATTQLVPRPQPNSEVAGNYKRRPSIDQESAHSVGAPLQPHAKRRALPSKVAVVQSQAAEPNDTRSCAADRKHAVSDQLSSSLGQRMVLQATERPLVASGAHGLVDPITTKQATSTVEAIPPLSQSAVEKLDKTELASMRHPVAQSAHLSARGIPLGSVPERKRSPAQTQAGLSSDFQPSVKQLKSTGKMDIGTSATSTGNGGEVSSQSVVTTIDNAANAREASIVMDSRPYVQETMSCDLRGNSHRNSSFIRPVQSSLPSRTGNAWGPSFGLAPPSHSASSVSRKLSTTPLSSWFLSKGCANFVKRVHFSDDDDAADDSSNSEDDASSAQPLSTLDGADRASLKRRTLVTKKNAFLESLAAQSYWRTWYGTVDLHNLLDPPLANIPDKLRIYEVAPLLLPEPMSDNNSEALAKKTNDLENLEADIRQEKQRGSAFRGQLLMMLQGKTASGKLLEEEYIPLLHQ